MTRRYTPRQCICGQPAASLRIGPHTTWPESFNVARCLACGAVQVLDIRAPGRRPHGGPVPVSPGPDHQASPEDVHASPQGQETAPRARRPRGNYRKPQRIISRPDGRWCAIVCAGQVGFDADLARAMDCQPFVWLSVARDLDRDQRHRLAEHLKRAARNGCILEDHP